MCVGDSNERILNGPMQYNDSVWFHPSVPDLTNVRTRMCAHCIIIFSLLLYSLYYYILFIIIFSLLLYSLYYYILFIIIFSLL